MPLTPVELLKRFQSDTAERCFKPQSAYQPEANPGTHKIKKSPKMLKCKCISPTIFLLH